MLAFPKFTQYCVNAISIGGYNVGPCVTQDHAMLLLASRTCVSLLVNCVFHGPWVNGHRLMMDTYLGTHAIVVPMKLVSCPLHFVYGIMWKTFIWKHYDHDASPIGTNEIHGRCTFKLIQTIQ